jgi:hypothetical protein
MYFVKGIKVHYAKDLLMVPVKLLVGYCVKKQFKQSAKYPVKQSVNRCISQSVWRVHSDETGSVTVEFVLLAIPLFLPILLFLGHFATLSNSELVARTLVRESLRAYVTSPNNEVAPDRAWQVMTIGGRAEGLTEEQIKTLDINFECSVTPCIAPNARIRATLKMQLPNQGRIVTAQAEEYISPWQFNGDDHGIQPKLTIEPGVIIDMALGSLIDLLPTELNYPAKLVTANL